MILTLISEYTDFKSQNFYFLSHIFDFSSQTFTFHLWNHLLSQIVTFCLKLGLSILLWYFISKFRLFVTKFWPFIPTEMYLINLTFCLVTLIFSQPLSLSQNLTFFLIFFFPKFLTFLPQRLTIYLIPLTFYVKIWLKISQHLPRPRGALP